MTERGVYNSNLRCVQALLHDKGIDDEFLVILENTLLGTADRGEFLFELQNAEVFRFCGKD